MPEIALVTYAASPDLTPDDRLLATALEKLGARPHAVPWDRPAPWGEFDLVLLRSPWDYFLRAPEWERWLAELERLGARLVNPLPVVRWNGDKRYLLQLAEREVRIVPTHHVAADGSALSPSLDGLLQDRGWDDAVVKPVVSAGGHGTWRTSRDAATADESRFRALLQESPGGLLVQPFVPEVVAEGEWSLIFIEGAYSHAAIKRAREGEFRVQHVHGGRYAAAEPSASLIADATHVVRTAAACLGLEPRDLAYARVDGVARVEAGDRRLMLMELECLEPSLFFEQAPEAADRMARAVVVRALANVGPPPYLR